MAVTPQNRSRDVSLVAEIDLPANEFVTPVSHKSEQVLFIVKSTGVHSLSIAIWRSATTSFDGESVNADHDIG
jgi:hypothetical protein